MTNFYGGIGDFYADKDKWRDIRTGEYGYNPNVHANESPWTTVGQGFGGADSQGSVAMQDWALKGVDGFMYRGDDGQRYRIEKSTSGLENLEDWQKKMNGDMSWQKPTYGVAPIVQGEGNRIEAYNGVGRDVYDEHGKYTHSDVPTGYGATGTPFWVDAAILAAMVGSAGIAGAYMAPAVAAEGGAVGAGVGAEAGAVGAGAGAEAGAAAGSGAFVGEGAASGVAGWDGALAGSGSWTSAGGTVAGTGPGWTGLSGTTPANPYYGSAGGTGAGAGTGGGAGAGAGTGTGSSGLLSGSTNIPGIGPVSNTTLAQLGFSAVGALSGSKGQESTTTSTKDLPDYLQGPVSGQGGLIPQANWLMNYQMNGYGTEAQKKKKKKTGLLSK